VTWFRDKGSRTRRFDFEVTTQPALDDTDGETAPFPMHGVPRDEVVGLVRKHGADLVHVEDGLRAGIEWTDYRYFVRGSP
jgi:hypothetical protein